MTDISVIIPSRPNDPFLLRAIQSVKNQLGVEYEILVIFNPHLPAWFEKNVRIFGSKIGVNSARNVGLKNARSDLLMFLDSDCVLPGKFSLAKRVELMNENPTWVASGGGYLVDQDANGPTLAYNYLQNHWLQSHIQNSELKTPFLLGGNMLLRKSNLGNIEFDENLIFGGTEREFFCRLHQATQNVYVTPHFPVRHLSSLSVKDLKYKAHAQAEGRRYSLKKGSHFEPQIRNIFAEAPQKKLQRYIEIYHSAYSKALMPTEWRERNSIKSKFQNLILDCVNGLDIAIQEIAKPKQDC